MAISVKYGQKLRLDLREDVDPIDVCGQKERTCRGDTELRFRMKDLELFNGTVSRFIRNQVTIFTQDVAYRDSKKSGQSAGATKSDLLL